MKRDKHYAEDDEDAHNNAPLLAYHAEYEIFRRRGDFFELSVADADAEQSAADAVDEHARLLIALAVHIVPDMAVGRKASHNKVGAYQHNESRRHRRADAQEHYRAEIAGAHEREDYKCKEEYQRRAEIAH